MLRFRRRDRGRRDRELEEGLFDFEPRRPARRRWRAFSTAAAFIAAAGLSLSPFLASRLELRRALGRAEARLLETGEPCVDGREVGHESEATRFVLLSFDRRTPRLFLVSPRVTSTGGGLQNFTFDDPSACSRSFRVAYYDSARVSYEAAPWLPSPFGSRSSVVLFRELAACAQHSAMGESEIRAACELAGGEPADDSDRARPGRTREATRRPLYI
jgi:hypothetical protein